MPGKDRKPATPADLMRASGQHMGHGLAFALSTLLFLLVGWWIDTKLGTEPVLLIVGAFVGATAGFYSLYNHIVRAAQNEDPEE